MDDPTQVRRATPVDAAPLAACHAACWREAYTGLIAEEVIEARHGDLVRRARRWEQILAGEAPTWVGVDGHEVVGFASTGPPRDEEVSHLAELYGLYLRASRYGTGLADRLVQPLIGDAPAFVWVLDPNPRAQAYYAKIGFRPDGASKTDPELGGAREIRMVRP